MAGVVGGAEARLAAYRDSVRDVLALAGTDVEAHRDFTRAAEEQRRLVIRLLNEDLMMRGAQAGDAYLSNRATWESIPNFTYHPPAVASAVRHIVWDVVVLLLWTVAAAWLAWHAVVRQRSV